MIRFLTVGPRWRIWSAGIHDGMTALRLRGGITRDPPLRHHAAFRRSLPAAEERRLPAVRLPLRFAELGLSLRGAFLSTGAGSTAVAHGTDFANSFSRLATRRDAA